MNAIEFLNDISVDGGIYATGITAYTNASDGVLALSGTQITYRTLAQLLTDLNIDTATGYVPYTGALNNVDLNFYNLTANYLQSTVTTGTAPLIVASSTMVSNLNSQYVGGFEAYSTAHSWGYVPIVYTNGGMEIGNVLNFHEISADTATFATRLISVSNELYFATNSIAINYKIHHNLNFPVLFTSPISTNLLQFNGTNWVNVALSSIAVASFTNNGIYVRADGTVPFTAPQAGVDPTASNHLVTKKYVDNAVSFIEDFYLTNIASSIAGYYQMIEDAIGEPAASFTTAALALGNGQLLVSYATNSGFPGINILKEGVYELSISALMGTSSTRIIKLYYELYTRDTGGVETLIATSTQSAALSDTQTSYNIIGVVDTQLSIVSTDVLVVKIYANVTGTGTNNTITIYTGDATGSRFSIPTSSEVLSTIFIRQDGTTPLSNNWNAGLWNITASKFITSGGTSSQFVKGDGTLDLNSYYYSGNFLAGSNYQAPISFTTNNNSGAATFISNVLNIPIYSLSGLGGQPLNTNLSSISSLSITGTGFLYSNAGIWSYQNANTAVYDWTANHLTAASLAGTGTRTVVVDATGQLQIGYAETANVRNYYCSSWAEVQAAITDINTNYNGGNIYLSGTITHPSALSLDLTNINFYGFNAIWQFLPTDSVTDGSTANTITITAGSPTFSNIRFTGSGAGSISQTFSTYTSRKLFNVAVGSFVITFEDCQFLDVIGGTGTNAIIEVSNIPDSTASYLIFKGCNVASHNNNVSFTMNGFDITRTDTVGTRDSLTIKVSNQVTNSTTLALNGTDTAYYINANANTNTYFISDTSAWIVYQDAGTQENLLTIPQQLTSAASNDLIVFSDTSNYGNIKSITVGNLVSSNMVYPSAGIAVSTGSAWGTSIANNSANWNTAYSWGDWHHTTLAGYGIIDAAPISGSANYIQNQQATQQNANIWIGGNIKAYDFISMRSNGTSYTLPDIYGASGGLVIGGLVDATGTIALNTSGLNTPTMLLSGSNVSISGNISAANFSGSSSGTNTGDQTLSSLGAQAQLNGTGFVKANGTTISYDNSNYVDYIAYTGSDSAIDANNLATNTMYYAWDNAYTTTTFSNFPLAIGSGGFGMIDIRIGSAYNFQLTNIYNTNDIYHRSSHYSGGKVYFPWVKFWDSGNSNLTTVDWNAQNLTLNGALNGATTGTFTGNVSAASLTSNRLGLFGVYNVNQVQGIWSIGTSFPINTTSNTFGSIYGIGYAFSTNGGAHFSGQHNIVFANSGVVTADIGLNNGDAWFNGNITGAVGTFNKGLTIIETGLVTSPTLGTATGIVTFRDPGTLYGLEFGIGGSGNTWIQSNRFDGTATAYNILLQPVVGNVFIGFNTDPTSGNKFAVNGNGYFNGTITVPGAAGRYGMMNAGDYQLYAPASGGWANGLSFFTNTGTSLGNAAAAFGSGSALTYFYYGGSYSSPLMVILPNGNVAIGTTTPSTSTAFGGTNEVNLLTLQSNGYPAIVLRTNNNDGASYQFESNTGTNIGLIGINYASGASNEMSFQNNLTSGFMTFSLNGIEAVRIDASQNLLLGTSTTYGSSYKLQVNGNSYINGAISALKFSGATTSSSTTLQLDNVAGNNAYMTAASSATTYTVGNTINNGFAVVLINTTSQPTVTGGTLTSGATWVASTNMYMVVWYNGNRVEYYFLMI